MARRKDPKVLVGALVASTLVAMSYKLYNYYKSDTKTVNQTSFTNKSIALTLSHSILNSQLPLNEILTKSENVTFILPPNLSIDDLACNIQGEDDVFNLPKTLLKNYKLLNCSNFQGYFNILKNLKPDMLVLCSDDLGISCHVPKDLDRFVKEIVDIDQDDTSKILPLFMR